MPEGPSLVILKEQTARFVGQEIVRAEGNTWAIDTTRLVGQLAHTQKTCPRCQLPFHKANLGRTNRRSFWCERCQKRYG